MPVYEELVQSQEESLLLELALQMATDCYYFASKENIERGDTVVNNSRCNGYLKGKTNKELAHAYANLLQKFRIWNLEKERLW